MILKIKNTFKTIITGGLAIALSVLAVYSITKAGSLTPPGSEATSTGYTLADIYNRLFDNSTATAGNHNFEPSASPTSTMYSLTQIYNLIPTIDPTKVLSGTTYLGVAGTYSGGGYTYGDNSADQVLTTAAGAGTWDASNLTVDLVATGTAWGTSSVGTLLGHLWNGTGQGITGGSQADGGVDDYNNGGSVPTDTYSKSWTQCTSENNYCGTNDSFADAKDNSTGLIWSKPCSGAGCFSYSEPSYTGYRWDNRGINNYSATTSASSTASQLCSNDMTQAPMSKNYHGAGWFLPHQKQLMSAYIDGAYGNLENIAVNRNYWSATTVSNLSSYVHSFYLSRGVSDIKLKTITDIYIRCVRSAP
jgi:hypothetical protein